VCFVTVLCRPDSNEDWNKYANDEEGDDEGDFEDDKDDTYSALAPVMKSDPVNLEVMSGETVVLPCATVNMSMMLS
jgi:hypothetical protein